MYPCLVLEQFCTTPIVFSFNREGVNVYGEPLEAIIVETNCNYQDKAKTILTEEKKLVEITGTALIPGDICKELPVITSGSATVFGVERQVVEGKKARNPDGTVNYTEVLLK